MPRNPLAEIRHWELWSNQSSHEKLDEIQNQRGKCHKTPEEWRGKKVVGEDGWDKKVVRFFLPQIKHQVATHPLPPPPSLSLPPYSRLLTLLSTVLRKG